MEIAGAVGALAATVALAAAGVMGAPAAIADDAASIVCRFDDERFA
ncbi:MAG: hypothetical protein ACYC3K_14615 [Candidatus Nanopelagicales bacterium]